MLAHLLKVRQIKDEIPQPKEKGNEERKKLLKKWE